jgi:hypothetical protein
MAEEKCPIWGDLALVRDGSNGRIYPSKWYNSPRAGGEYTVTGEVVEDHLINKSEAFNLTTVERARLTTWLVDRRREGVKCPEVNPTVIEIIKLSKNLQFSQKKKRFFDYLLSYNIRIGEYVHLTPLPVDGGQVDYSRTWQLWFRYNEISAWIESSNRDETGKFIDYMHESKLIRYESEKHLFSLTVTGWEALEDYQRLRADSNQVFVAQWFGGAAHKEEMDKLFEDGMSKGVEDCDLGLKAFRIDQKEHNGKICDEIIAEIRRSKLVIADFTCEFIEHGGQSHPQIRGGVYYEAGFAYGLGIPVIFTCKKDSEGAIHFDTRQYNHILWETHAELAEKLKQRIKATFNPKYSRP